MGEHIDFSDVPDVVCIAAIVDGCESWMSIQTIFVILFLFHLLIVDIMLLMLWLLMMLILLMF